MSSNERERNRGESDDGFIEKLVAVNRVSKKIGEAIAKACLAKNVSQVVFDRNGFPYHGRVAAVADAAREAGLKF